MKDELIISLVEEAPMLYSKKDINYKNNLKKQQAWVEIAAKVGASADAVSKRWLQLRERFCKETRAMNAASGSGANAFTRWPYYAAMEFLRPHITARQQKSNFPFDTKIEIPAEETPQFAAFSSASESCESTPMRRNLKRKHGEDSADAGCIKATSAKTQICENTQNPQQSKISPEVKSFGDLITGYINHLPKAAQLQLMSSIMQQVAEVYAAHTTTNNL